MRGLMTKPSVKILAVSGWSLVLPPQRALTYATGNATRNAQQPERRTCPTLRWLCPRIRIFSGCL